MTEGFVGSHLLHWTLRLGNTNFWTLHMDTILVSLAIGLLSHLSIYLIVKNSKWFTIGGFQNAIETFFEWIEGLVAQNYKASNPLLTSTAISLFLWIALMNLCSLLPLNIVNFLTKSSHMAFKIVPTEDINICLSMAIFIFLLELFYEIKNRGFLGFIKHMLFEPFGVVLLPANLSFHLIEKFVRPLSLTLRLFGNLFAGGMIFIIISTVPYWLQWLLGALWSIMHLPALLIQAFIFMSLTIAYISGTKPHHHEVTVVQ